MRRRTKKKSIGGRRIVIYLAVIAIMWLVERVYTNYIEPNVESIEQISQSPAQSRPSDEPQAEKQQAEKPQTNKQQTNKSQSNKQQSNKSQAEKSQAEKPSRKKGATYRAGWAELPATSQDKELYTTHHYEQGQRNFTACYSSKHLCPIWVAAPLHSCYKGEAKRSDSFTYDPTISIDIQPSLSRSYGEYTRGHLLGSAERTVSRTMNKQTFYASNIAPQLQEGFNAQAGAWNNTEKIVSKQICADTLYVVTGCLFDDYTHTDGRKVKASTTINKGDGKTVSVPTAYYKALLRTKRGTTGKSVVECSADELKCAAIIVPHTSASKYKPSKKDLISIEELEQLSGVEFFANVANAPKAKANPADWGM